MLASDVQHIQEDVFATGSHVTIFFINMFQSVCLCVCEFQHKTGFVYHQSNILELKNYVVMSVITLFTPFCFNGNVALRDNKIWQCNVIAGLKSALHSCGIICGMENQIFHYLLTVLTFCSQISIPISY